MIKELQKIPGSPERTQREQIRADINEALERKVRLFEFVGDIYNYKTLQASAANEARWMTSTRLKAAFYKKHPELRRWFVSHIDTRCQWIKVRSKKDGDKRRVFCEINEAEFERALEECIEKAKARKESSEQRRQGHGA